MNPLLSNLGSPADSICVLQCIDGLSSTHGCSHCKQQNSLQAQIADAKDHVQALENRLFTLRSTISQRNDPITSKFPVEIISHVFELFVALHAVESPYSDRERAFQVIPNGAALVLGAVCRKWRTIAWTTPRLWTTLVVNLLAKGHAHGPDLVEQWFDRTRRLPTDVCFLARGGSHITELKGHAEAYAESTMKVLHRFMPQVRRLDLKTITFDLVSKLRDLGPEGTSVLQRLRLGGGPGLDKQDTDDAYEFYSALFGTRYYANVNDSPHRPTHLYLSCSIPFDKLNIDWTNLTHVDLSRVSRATSVYILEAAAQSLTHVTMLWIRDDDTRDFHLDDWVPESPIECPLLRFLNICESESHAGFTAIIFNSITVPSLKSLEYSGCGYAPERRPMPIDAIITCLQRSGCNLEHLKLDWPAVDTTEEIIELLHETPTVQSFDLSRRSGLSVEPIFQALARQATGFTLLPNLKKLKVNAHHPFSWTSFVNIWLEHQTPKPLEPMSGTFLLTDFLLRGDDPKVNPSRAELSASLVVRGALEPSENYIWWRSLAVLLRMSKHIGGSIAVTADGGSGRSVSREDEYDLLERSFQRYFPSTQFAQLLKLMNKVPSDTN